MTPAAQSRGSACSAGEWETPVGLRTNSMPAEHAEPGDCATGVTALAAVLADLACS